MVKTNFRKWPADWEEFPGWHAWKPGRRWGGSDWWFCIILFHMVVLLSGQIFVDSTGPVVKNSMQFGQVAEVRAMVGWLFKPLVKYIREDRPSSNFGRFGIKKESDTLHILRCWGRSTDDAEMKKMKRTRKKQREFTCDEECHEVSPTQDQSLVQPLGVTVSVSAWIELYSPYKHDMEAELNYWKRRESWKILRFCQISV